MKLLKILNQKTVVLLASFFLMASLMPNNDIYVSPDGNDSFPGSSNKPFRTIQKAYSVMKSRAETMNNGTLTVILRDGIYHISEPLIFSEIVNENVHLIWKAAKGAHPVISGALTANSTNANEKCSFSYADSSKLFDLYVNGKRATRARTPNSGYFRFSKVGEEILVQGTGRIPERARQLLVFPEEASATLSGLSVEELKNTRFHALMKWDNSIRYLSGKAKDEQAFITEGLGMQPWNQMGTDTRFFLENYPAALDAPGEWQTSGKQVTYIPQTTEKGKKLEFEIPVSEKLLIVKGTADRKIKNITFDGISFQYSNYVLPKSGFEPMQAAVTIDAAIEIEHAENIDFQNCEIAHTGQHAIWFRKGVKNCAMNHCQLHELGAGGVYIGATVIPEDSLDVTRNIRIENCIIQSGGYNFPSAVGVWIGQSGNNQIIHNDIADFRYTGVSVGWVWGYAYSPAKNNKIKFNRIHHIGWAMLSDMSGVYTLGQSEGTEVSNNVVHDIHAWSYGGWGLYTDEGSTGIKMENNLVYNTKTGGFHQHYGKENIIRNNIFAFADQYQIQATRVEDHLSFTFENNIVIGEEGILLAGPWEKIKLNMDKNCYWFKDGKPFDFVGMSFEKWKLESGHDQQSIVANPGNVDLKNETFRLNPDVVKRVGFEIFNPQKAGVFGSKSWLKKAILDDSIIKAFEKEVILNRNEK